MDYVDGGKGPYERWFCNALKIKGKNAHLGELELNLPGHKEAGAATQAFAKALSPIVCPNEVDKVVETEKCFQGACPLIAGAHTHFGLANKRFGLIPEEERHTMTGTASFVTFWTGIVSDISLPLPLFMRCSACHHCIESHRNRCAE